MFTKFRNKLKTFDYDLKDFFSVFLDRFYLKIQVPLKKTQHFFR